MNIKTEKNIAEIDLNKSGTYVVCNGEIKYFLPTPSSGYGKHEINWQNGKVPLVHKSETMKN